MTNSSQTFKRIISEKLIKKLQEEDLFKKKLLPDIKTGDVFPAIRNQRIDFYHKGGKLFEYNEKGGFKTHIKYAAVIKNKGKDYLTKSELKAYRLPLDFSTNYDRIKENCTNYAGIENSGIANIYKEFTYFKKKTDIVVLDIEISFKSLNEEKKQDRIDILLFNKNTKMLRFVEAKHYSNTYIRSKGVPKVVGQIEEYESQINDKHDDIIKEYGRYVEKINKLFYLDIPKPEGIYDKVTLLIFGFDNDQLTGKLKEHKSKIENENINTYCKGSISKDFYLTSLWENNF